MSLQDYLLKTKRHVQSWKTGESIPSSVHVVIGNESCDLDSAVSSIVFAYFLWKIGLDSIVVPVLNIVRLELRLRTEVTHVMSKHHIPLDLLPCKDDIDFEHLHDLGVLSLILVDHNALPEQSTQFIGDVNRVIDHHQKGEHTIYPEHFRVEPVGSCCTLIADEIFKGQASLVDGQVADLLYSTIILDTICLDEAAKRVTPKDIEMAEQLQTHLSDILQSTDRCALYRELVHAKSDISGLTTAEILEKDLKSVYSSQISVAISSIPDSIKTFVGRANVETDLYEFSSKHDTKLVILMGLHHDLQKGVSRDLAVFSRQESYRQQMVDVLMSYREPNLELEAVPTDEKLKHLLLFKQGNVGASRKVILPLVENYLATLKV